MRIQLTASDMYPSEYAHIHPKDETDPGDGSDKWILTRQDATHLVRDLSAWLGWPDPGIENMTVLQRVRAAPGSALVSEHEA